MRCTIGLLTGYILPSWCGIASRASDNLLSVSDGSSTVSDSFFGPYYGSDGKTITDQDGTFGDLVIGPDENVAGTGHHTIIKDNVGEYLIIYHGFNINSDFNEERIAFMDKILWDENGFPYVKNKVASVGTLLPGPTVYKV